MFELAQTAPAISVDTAQIISLATSLIGMLMPIAVVGIAVSIGMKVFKAVRK